MCYTVWWGFKISNMFWFAVIFSRTYESLGNLSHRTWLGQSVMEKVSPAHDFMSQEHTAHLRILVLTFIYDGLWTEREKVSVSTRTGFIQH